MPMRCSLLCRAGALAAALMFPLVSAPVVAQDLAAPPAGTARAGAQAQAIRHLQSLRQVQMLAAAGQPGQAARAAETLLDEDRRRADAPLALRWRFQSMAAAAGLHAQLGHDERAIALYREILDTFKPDDTDFAPRALMESVDALDQLCRRSGQPGVALPYLAAFLAQPSMQAPANLLARTALGRRLGTAALAAHAWTLAETSLLDALEDTARGAGVVLPVGVGDSPAGARFGDLTAFMNHQQVVRERLAAAATVQVIADEQGQQIAPLPSGAFWLDADTPAANLGRLYHLQGRPDALARFYRGAFAGYAARVQAAPQADGYADLEKEYARLGLYLAAAGNWPDAHDALYEALRLNGTWLQAHAHGAPPDQLRQTFAKRRELRDMIVSWYLGAGGTPAQRQAMLGDVLQDKALAHEMLARRARAVRRAGDPETRRLADEIDAIDALGSVDGYVRRANLEYALQGRIGAGVAPLTFEPGARFLERVASALGGATLVSFTVWRPFDFAAQQFGAPRYLGAVVGSAGTRVVDLGPAAAIDPVLAVLRGELAAPPAAGRAAQALVAARAAYRVLIEPLLGARAADGSYLAELDGATAQVPLEAMADADGRYLIDAGPWRYLTSARVLAAPPPPPPRAPGDLAAVLVNADYDARAAGSPGAPPSGSRLRALQGLHFAALPATAEEGRDVAAALKGAGMRVRLATGSGASAAALRQLRAPRWLHVATHGFYLEEAGMVRERRQGNDGKTYLVERYAADFSSGLALAGANAALAPGAGRGLLYAADLQRLDLEGTELVVLSACDSARGAVAVGEAVAGLRQAIEIAGAHATLTSLWSVPDRGTRALMAGFYAGLAAGAGKAEALRSAKLAVRRTRPHPFYWAPFILSGSD